MKRRQVVACWLLAGLILLGAGARRFFAQERSSEPSRTALAGRQIGDFTLGDCRGTSWSLGDFPDAKLVVVAFLGTECPLAQQYSSQLVELSEKYKDRGVVFLGINANQQDSLTEIAHHARTHKIEFPVLKDAGNVVADQFAAQRTPEVFVLDQQRVIRYRGAIDDQYTYGIQRPKATREHLAAAIDELLAGKRVSTPVTEVAGCHIGRVLKSRADSEVTYSQQISRILQKHCVECHRPGEIAPFSLTNYEEAVGWAEMIDEVVQQQRMPPWHADPKYGHFINDSRLSDEEKQLIHRWYWAGAPEGNPKELPAPREFADGWRIGKPDQVVYMSDKPFNVPAKGEVKYQFFSVDPGFTEDKWIQAAECRPGNRSVVHHIIVGVLPRELGDAALHGLRSQWLTATAPGARPLVLDDGYAKFVPAGARLVFQMHYTPNGTPQQDRSSVGLIFADPAKVQKLVATQQAATRSFRIPAGDDNHQVQASFRFKDDSLMLALFPHMHLRGKSFRYTAKYPDGKQEILLDVPHYDFNWQNSYEFAQPKRMPAGTLLECVAHYDNSERNLANPDPNQSVSWGDQTWEEMMIGYFDMALADQDLSKLAKANAGESRTAKFLEQARSGTAAIDDELRRLARQALSSSDDMEKFGVELRKRVPQLDRVCWTTVSDRRLHVRQVAQIPALESVGRNGTAIPVLGMGLPKYVEGTTTVVHQDLRDVSGLDFRTMSRALASSMHVPVKTRGESGTINFWSTDAGAFPDEAVQLLKQVAQLMAEEAK
jgi:peroxiredoxin